MTFSDEYHRYVKMYKQMHQTTDKFPGGAIKKHAEEIGELLRQTESRTLLDYGCGRGDQYYQHRVQDHWPRVKIAMFDPGVTAYGRKPEGIFDAVVVCDVMEHVPESAVDDVLQDIFASAGKFVFFSIRSNKAKAFLPDGTNAHCTIKPPEWWAEKVSAHNNGVPARIRCHIRSPERDNRNPWKLLDV